MNILDYEFVKWQEKDEVPDMFLRKNRLLEIYRRFWLIYRCSFGNRGKDKVGYGVNLAKYFYRYDPHLSLQLVSAWKARLKSVEVEGASEIEVEQKAISLEKALWAAGYHGKKLYPKHLEKTCKAAVNEGKTLRIQFKNLYSFDIKISPWLW